MRKVAVVTGTRADYGLLYWLMKDIDCNSDMELQTIVTGMHLSPEFGLTYQVIVQDGFRIDAKVEMLLSSDTPVGTAKSMGLGVIGFAEAYDRLKPDVVVLLGDRYEILAAAQAALVAGIQIAHIHGGELTEGAFDDAIRHAVTKMANFHFVAAEPYRRRVVQLGEQPDHVYLVGAPGLDHIHRTKLLDRQQFEKAIQFELGYINFLVTYHPVTLGNMDSANAMEQLLNALDAFPEAKVIITKPNSDPNGRIIGKMIDAYSLAHKGRVSVYTSLGQVRYLSALKHVDLVIGNSSSGIIEVPAFGKPTVNIGDRQKGRLRTSSIIDCAEHTESIITAIQTALSPVFLADISAFNSLPYGKGHASEQIIEFLKTVNLDGLARKTFYDIEHSG